MKRANSVCTGMQMPTVSVAIMVGVLMLQLPPISTVDAAECVHPGGCVSCGYQTSFAAVIKADDSNVAATLSEYTESALGSGRNIKGGEDGTLRGGATVGECNEVAQVLRDVMGWGTGTSILGCGYDGGGPFGYLLMGACGTALSQIQELVNTVYCLNKPNGCVSCPAGGGGLLQADDRALAALTDIVTADITVNTPEVFSNFTKGDSAQGGPGIFARGGHAQCQEGREILVEKLTAIDTDFELGCTALSSSQSFAPGFLKGCSNPATIGVLQALIDEHAIGATTLTTAAAATTTVPAVCNQEPKAGDGEITCSGGAQQRCISVNDKALNTINCMLDGEGIAPVTMAQGTNDDRCITTSSDAHCQAVSAYFYTHVPDEGQACNGDCTLHCPGTGLILKSEDCGETGSQYLKDMADAYNSTRSIVHITLSTDFGGLQFEDPNIVDAGCKAGDTSPSTIAMTAFFLGQGLDVYVRCNGNENLELYMTGKDKDKAAKAMDSFHRKIPGNNGPVPGQMYHIAFNVEDFVITVPELGSGAGRNLATNIQEVLTVFATTANAAASLTTTPTTIKIATVTTTRTTTTRTPYPNMPLTASSDLELQDLGCTSHNESAATHAFAALLDEMGCAGAAVHCLHDNQNQLCMSPSIQKSCVGLANAMEVQAEAQGLPSTTCESAACWIRFSYQSSADGCMLLKLYRRNGPAANNQIVANLNALLGLETASTSSTTTATTTPAAAFPTPNRKDLHCDMRTNRYLATSNCMNVEAADGSIVRASGGTRFLEEYYANRNPRWKGSGTITCWTDAKDDGLHDIVFEDVALCDAFQSIIGQSEGVLECEEIGENDDDFPVGLTFIRYANKADCKGMVGISTLTLGKTTATTATTAAPTTAPVTAPMTAPTTAASSSTINDKGGGSNVGTDQPEDASDDSSNDTSNGGGDGPPGDANSTESSSADNKTSTRGGGGNPTNTTDGDSSAPPTVPQQSASSSTSTIVGVLAALIVVLAVVGFILWRQKLSTGAAGGIPHVGDQNGGGGGGVPPIYHNRMYNIGTSAPSEACLQPGALQPPVYGSQHRLRSTVSATEAGVVYAIPVDLQDEGGTDINGYATPLANYAVVGAGGGGGGTPNGGGTDINGYATPLANYAVVGAGGGGGGTPNGGGNHDYAIPEARSRANPLLPLDLDGYVVDDAAPAGGGASGGPVYATPAANSSDI